MLWRLLSHIDTGRFELTVVFLEPGPFQRRRRGPARHPHRRGADRAPARRPPHGCGDARAGGRPARRRAPSSYSTGWPRRSSTAPPPPRWPAAATASCGGSTASRTATGWTAWPPRCPPARSAARRRRRRGRRRARLRAGRPSSCTPGSNPTAQRPSRAESWGSRRGRIRRRDRRAPAAVEGPAPLPRRARPRCATPATTCTALVVGGDAYGLSPEYGDRLRPTRRRARPGRSRDDDRPGR